MLKTIVLRWRRARAAARTRRELESLDAGVLRDLGITRSEIPGVAKAHAESLVPLQRRSTKPQAPVVTGGIGKPA